MMKSWPLSNGPESPPKTPETVSAFAAASFVVFVLKDVWQHYVRRAPKEQVTSVRILNEP